MFVEFTGVPYRWEARTEEWVFVDLPEPLSADIAEIPRPRRGFGGVRVEVRIGATVWRTSIFPQSDPVVYVLPLKRSVREAEGVELGREVAILLDVLDL
ncbi:DUF1905 domain-containing protein [Leucobacter triazinivorans]|uniref:DUF1905 domain-containing protein n=1 Tax=Leucobacter triazinivorans TaxID=1784719 RepID=A0A4P6KGA1_9MICO|nr:DUF1905 domain-containing protein [Leucobacter triazinivorans]QBE49456.1 DUF1905 domain-containing protein [Leucobacter triazinivorans]